MEAVGNTRYCLRQEALARSFPQKFPQACGKPRKVKVLL